MLNDLKIERLPGKALGRCAGSAFGPFVFIATVAHDRSADFHDQTLDVLSRLEEQLASLGSVKGAILSATVFLSDMANKETFDREWIEWIGPDQAGWPQRACVGAALAGTTQVEIVLIAVRQSTMGQ